MRKKRGKPSFVGKSKNLLFALLVVAAAVTVYGIAQAAVVSHTASEIIGKVGTAAQADNSDLLQGLSSADILAAVGGGGEFPSTAPVGYSIDYDWDRDGKSAKAGDCDETCPTCYSGSGTVTTTPNNKDEDCDGVLDEPTTAGASKSCNLGTSTCVDWEGQSSQCNNFVPRTVLSNACSSWCSSQGRGGSALTATECYSYAPAWDNPVYGAFEFGGCGRSSETSPSQGTTVCQRTVSCACDASGYQ